MHLAKKSTQESNKANAKKAHKHTQRIEQRSGAANRQL